MRCSVYRAHHTIHTNIFFNRCSLITCVRWFVKKTNIICNYHNSALVFIPLTFQKEGFLIFSRYKIEILAHFNTQAERVWALFADAEWFLRFLQPRTGTLKLIVFLLILLEATRLIGLLLWNKFTPGPFLLFSLCLLYPFVTASLCGFLVRSVLHVFSRRIRSLVCRGGLLSICCRCCWKRGPAAAPPQPFTFGWIVSMHSLFPHLSPPGDVDVHVVRGTIEWPRPRGSLRSFQRRPAVLPVTSSSISSPGAHDETSSHTETRRNQLQLLVIGVVVLTQRSLV